ncbi:MAG: zf-HC2 domain-containing protein, partial [Gemmataceae bacterium]|nr:zf-HC2 domain-containing protein [Gemmataceae bacterium]
MNCQTAKPLLLDYVYGALESVESQPLEQHLTGCGPCQQALVWTKSCQIKLKQASLEAFPELQFQAETLLNPLLSAPPVKARKWSSSRWAFLVAAAVLILLFPVWFLFLNQENGQGPRGQEFVFADQDGRKTGLELAQLELVFKEAVALAKDPNRVDQAQSNFS